MNKQLYYEAADELLQNPNVRRMKEFPHHNSSNTLAHSIHVAAVAGKIASKMNLRVHEKELARGCILHDYYLYNTQEMEYSAYRHGTRHAGLALKNASREYELTEIEKDMIYSHMWPLNLTHLPHYKESLLIVIADKYCAVREFMHMAPDVNIDFMEENFKKI